MTGIGATEDSSPLAAPKVLDEVSLTLLGARFMLDPTFAWVTLEETKDFII